MKRIHHPVFNLASPRTALAASMAAVLAGACSTAPPKTVSELETARALVPQVEASPRAGVAASYVSEARKSLDQANRMSDERANPEDVRYEASIATLNAQIANEKILAAQARDEIERGEMERKEVLLQAREREARRHEQEAQAANARASSLEQELEQLRAKPTSRGMVLTLGEVLFDTDKATLKPGAYETLDRLAQALKREPDRHVLIEGHTDSTGTQEHNQTLSERRADAVRDALIERGVRSDQIQAVGKGQSFPVATNANAAGRQQNRRVELVFAGTGPKPPGGGGSDQH